MNKPMSNEESFDQRRKLFREVWASTMDDEDTKHRHRPKVVKTLNLDDIEQSTGKRKKQKIRNLRTVCHKLLEYCDRQEANYSAAQVTAFELQSPENKIRAQSRPIHSGEDNAKPKPKRICKTIRLKLPKSAANGRDNKKLN